MREDKEREGDKISTRDKGWAEARKVGGYGSEGIHGLCGRRVSGEGGFRNWRGWGWISRRGGNNGGKDGFPHSETFA